MAKFLVRAHRTVRPSLRRVLIWNRTAERAATLARELEEEDIVAEITTDLDAATHADGHDHHRTRATVPLIKGANLRPGVHLELGWRIYASNARSG